MSGMCFSTCWLVALLAALCWEAAGQPPIYVSTTGLSAGDGSATAPYDIVTAQTVVNETVAAGGNVSLLLYSGTSTHYF